MNNFLPFGAQYYRAPTPMESEWEKDLKNISSYGFNTIKLWAQWRWNNPGEDKYYFDDLDRLMDLADANGLKVIINIIYDVAPAWFYLKYPDSKMITSSGQILEPTTCACRQIGGLPGPCFHHMPAIEEKLKFTSHIIKRYREHPALYCWDLWNEPELCYNTRKPEVSNLVCYCGNSRKSFIDWLSAKYGSIDKVNQVWSRNYQNWDELELPRDPRSFKDMIDWRVFFIDTLSQELGKRVELAKSLDLLHPVMVHNIAAPKVNGADDYEMAQMCDMFGGSVNNDPYYNCLFSSMAGGKPVIAAEIHANGGFALDRGGISDFNQYKGYILVPLAYGCKGFQYWQYRPELLGMEAPKWGMTTFDGEKMEWVDYSIRINNVLQENKDIILNGAMRKPSVGIISSSKNQIFNWCANDEYATHEQSVKGAFSIFHDLNINAVLVDTKQIQQEKLEQFKVLFYPFPYYMEQKTADVLKQWVYSGGILISEAFFGSYSDDTGLHSTVVPGFGFDEVFGVKEYRSTCTSCFEHSCDDNDGVDGLSINDVNVVTAQGTPLLTGYYFMEELRVQNAEVLGAFDGSPLHGSAAAAVSAYGRGKAYFVGTLISKRYYERPIDINRNFIGNILREHGIDSEIRISGDCMIKTDLIEGQGEALMVIRNLTDNMCNALLSIHGSKYTKGVDLFKGSTFTADGSGTFCIELEPQEISLYKFKV